MAAMMVLRPRKTYLDWVIELMRYILPAKKANETSLDTIMDAHKEKIVKEGAKQQKGNKTRLRVHVLTPPQKMPQGKASQRFLSNDNNRNNLISFFVKFEKSPEIKENCRYVNAPLFLQFCSVSFLLFLYDS